MKPILKKPALLTLLLAATASLSGCSNLQIFREDARQAGAAFGLLRDHQIQRSSNHVFPVSAGFYIAWDDLQTHDELDIERRAAGELYKQVARHFPRAALATAAQSLPDALHSSLQQRMDYLIYPRVLLWKEAVGNQEEMTYALGEDEVVSGFGLDRAQLQLAVLESSTGRIVDVAVVHSRTGLLSLRGDSSQQLLGIALQQYADSLFP